MGTLEVSYSSCKKHTCEQGGQRRSKFEREIKKKNTGCTGDTCEGV